MAKKKRAPGEHWAGPVAHSPPAPATLPPPIPRPQLVPEVTRRSIGRPSHEPSKDTKNVVMLAKAGGFTDVQTAGLLSISENTLRKHYSYELTHGADRITHGIMRNLARIAMSETHPKAVQAGSFWLSSKNGWGGDGKKGGVRIDFDSQGEDGRSSNRFSIIIGDKSADGDL